MEGRSANTVVSNIVRMADEIGPISREEEFCLILEAQGGNEASRRRLCGSFGRYVVKAARKLSSKWPRVGVDCLAQAGMVGLLIAPDKFDFTRGGNFLSCAKWWIWNEMYREAGRSRTVYLPETAAARLRRVREASDDLRGKWGREATVEEIGEMVNVRAAEVCNVLAADRCYSLDARFPAKDGGDIGGDVGPYLDIVAAGDDPEMSAVETRHDVAVVESICNEILPDRANRILHRCMEGVSMRVVGIEEGGISHERVRQIRDEALDDVQREFHRREQAESEGK